MKFIAKNLIIDSELDIYADGCQPDTSETQFFDHITIDANDINQLLDAVAEFFGVPRADIVLNACDEIGRIDIQWYSTERNLPGPLGPATLERWKNGELNLYLNNASLYVEQSQAFDFSTAAPTTEPNTDPGYDVPENPSEYIDAALELLSDRIGYDDVQCDDECAPPEQVDGGCWVTARVFIDD